MKKFTRREILAASAALAATAGAGRAAFAQDGSIKFGVCTALSGDAAAYGKPFGAAIDAMAAIFNEQGGILGRQVKVITYDDRGVPDQALQAAKKLVQSDRVVTMQPGSTSGAILTALPVGKAGPVAMWGYGLAEQWLVEGEGMIFRSAPPDVVLIPGLAKFAVKELKLKNIGIMHIDSFYGETARDIFADEVRKAGAAIAGMATYSDGTRDFSAQLITLAQKNIDALFLVVQGGAVAPALRQIKQFLPPNIKILGTNELYTAPVRAEAGDLMEGIYYYMHPMVEQSKDAVVHKWLDEMKTRLGTNHEIFGRAIVGMLVMKEAISRANSTNAIDIMKQVHRLKNVPTPLGPFTYDPRDGEGLKSSVVMLAKAGKDVSKDEVVFKGETDRELYKKRVNYTRFFGAAYAEELYKFHGVS